jgi:hypothetical protein
VVSIHLASSEPPRETMPMRRFLTSGRCRLAHAGVDGHVVDALLGLVLDGLEDDLLVEVFELAPDDHRVDRDGADGHGASCR